MRTLCLLALSTVTLGAQTGPFKWTERYADAVERLNAAEGDLAYLYGLGDVAKAAFEVGKVDEARRYAQEALDLSELFADYRRGQAIHDGHMVLGRIALREGDVEEAERELLEAGKTRGSPVLNSFGPNMSLAKDLLEEKRIKPVVEYFEMCSEFWEREDGRLRRWTVLAKGGEIPDFGANLLY